MGRSRWQIKHDHNGMKISVSFLWLLWPLGSTAMKWNVKTESTRKLSNLNFQRTKTLYQMTNYIFSPWTRSAGVVSGQLFGSSTVSLACITPMCSVQRFSGGHSLRLAFGSFFYPHPSPLYSSTDKSVWQVPRSIGVGVHGWRTQVCEPLGSNSV